MIRLFTFCIALLSGLQVFSQCDTFFGKLVINELVASNNSSATDEFGEHDDWVEIYNSTDEYINMEGYFLSDNHGSRTKFVFPDISIEPQGYLIIWCDGQPEQGELHTDFGLSAGGEELGLYDLDTNAVDYVRFTEMPTDVSMGRFPNGTGPFARLIPSYNAENANSVPVGLVINEFMASNTITATDQYGAFEDWIEIYNNGNNEINLGGYFLSDKIGDPTMYEFPDTVLSPDSYLIVWADQGLMEPGLHAFFKLGADGDDIILSNSDTATIDYVRFDLQYEDVSEGRFPNGTGAFECPLPSFGSSNGTPSSIAEVDINNLIRVYPNPANTVLNIDYEGQGTISARVRNVTGKTVDTVVLNPGANRLMLNNLGNGLYLLETEKGTIKFLKQD